MRADRVILRSILTTLLAIVVLLGIMLFILCVIFPSTMMQLTYNLGMNKSSVKYAARAYKRTDDVYYAAFATETSILLEDAEKIEKNGLLLIADDEFAKYCQMRNDEIAKDNETATEEEKISISYQQYVYGQVTMAQYSQGKKTEAISTAFASLGGAFEKGNAAALLYITASRAQDLDTIGVTKAKLEALRATQLSETDRAYLETLLSL